MAGSALGAVRGRGGSARTRVGAGAGFAGDRLGPAIDLLRHAALDDLVLECLAERTIALSQLRRMHDPHLGYDERLERRLRALLPAAQEHGTRIVTNMGAANPLAAAKLAQRVIGELGLSTRVAAVTGDDVLDGLDLSRPAIEDGLALAAHGEIISANAYLGAEALLPALRGGADLVIAGRVADPSLYVAVLADRLGWDLAEWGHMATASMVGHLLECAAQVSGGYFADPGKKGVPDLDRVGFPFAEVGRDQSVVVTKLPQSGGAVSVATVTEQLLYEITDPGGYVTPDVVLDLRGASLHERGADRVEACGATGRTRPESLKVSVGYIAGLRADAEISYAGANARARARLAVEVLAKRLGDAASRIEFRIFDGTSSALLDERPDVHDVSIVRVAGMGPSRTTADDICHEVESLYTNGPAGGGGVRLGVRQVVGIVSTLIARSDVSASTTFLEPQNAPAFA